MREKKLRPTVQDTTPPQLIELEASAGERFNGTLARARQIALSRVVDVRFTFNNKTLTLPHSIAHLDLRPLASKVYDMPEGAVMTAEEVAVFIKEKNPEYTEEILEFQPGSSLVDILKAARQMAEDRGVTVRFSYNNITCSLPASMTTYNLHPLLERIEALDAGGVLTADDVRDLLIEAEINPNYRKKWRG